MKISPTLLGGCLLAIGLTGALPRLAHADPADPTVSPAAARPPLPFLLAAASAVQGSALPPPPPPPFPAAGGRPGPFFGAFSGPFGEEPLPPVLCGIKLSEAQQDQAFAILHEQAPRLREQGKILHHSGEAMRALVASASFDEAKARALAEAEGRARAELGLLLARSDSRLLALLTPEQRQQLDALKVQLGHQDHTAAEHRGERG